MEIRTKSYDVVKKVGGAGFASFEKEGYGGKTRKGTVIFQRPMGFVVNLCPQGDTTTGIGLSHSKEDDKIFCQALEPAAERISVHGDI